MPSDEPFISDDPVVNGTYTMADDMEKIAMLLSAIAFKYFSSSDTSAEWIKWRTNAKKWLATYGDEFPLQGLADVFEEVLNEAYLFPVDYQADDGTDATEPIAVNPETLQAIPEEPGTPVRIGYDGGAHNVEEPRTRNFPPAPFDLLPPHQTDLACDFCQLEPADRFVQHLGMYFCRNCYWANRDLTQPTEGVYPYETPNHLSGHQEDQGRRCLPVHDHRRADEGTPREDGDGDRDSLSWDAFTAGDGLAQEPVPA